MRWICILIFIGGCSNEERPADTLFLLQQLTYDCKEIEHLTPARDEREWNQLAMIRTRRMLLLADAPLPSEAARMTVVDDYEFWKASQKETQTQTRLDLQEEYLIATRITAERFRLRGMQNLANMISNAFTPEQATN